MPKQKRKINNKILFNRWQKQINSNIDNNIKNDLRDYLEFTRTNFFIKNTKKIKEEEDMYNSMKLISDVYIQEKEKTLVEREKNKKEKMKMELFFKNEIKKLAIIVKNKIT